MAAPECITDQTGKWSMDDLEEILKANDPFYNPDCTHKYSIEDDDYSLVFPNVYISSSGVAKRLGQLHELGITHVVNAVKGPAPFYCNTSQDYYKPNDIQFLGFEADDQENYPLHQHFDEAAEFIQNALDGGGKVLVHCIMGISRAPSLVIAYLMKKRHMNVKDALITVKKKRDICPNSGFLQQLCDLNDELVKQNHFSQK